MKKLGRPKGSKQKRNENKYILPKGVTLKHTTDNYNKETKLVFIDEKYGEFISSFKAITRAKASTHPMAVKERREKTNIKKYGGPNPHCSVEVRKKAKHTMKTRYGVEHALQNTELLKKSRQTLFQNYGVNEMMDSQDFRNQIKKTNLIRYGCENPMGNTQVQMRQFYSAVESGNQWCSSGETEVKEFVQSLGYNCSSKFIYNNKFKRQLDIFIPELNIAIEYNGLYWHSEANSKIYNRYHLDKTEMCESKNIRLIQIFEHEWNNRKEQVKSFLRSALKKNEIRVHARKTSLRMVDKETAKRFLELYHIQGAPHVIGMGLGLFYEEELLSLITIGKHHRNNKEVVLTRFVTKTNVTVVGGLSKLTKEALNLFPEIVTWVDRRWSTGNSWIKYGWEQVHVLPPDYFYFNNKTGEVVPKQNRQKKKLNTPNYLTEHQHALIDNLYRIYDCGKIKLIIRKSQQ